jgi:hypothetical protein
MQKINRDIWLVKSFSPKKRNPAWPCPFCGTGSIHGDKNTLKIEQSRNTRIAKRSTKIVPTEKAKFIFSGFLVCNNHKCEEKVAVAGKGVLKADINDNEVLVSYKGGRYSEYIPTFFEPALNIFPICVSIPEDINNQIKYSFSHYFNDPAACANSIRTCIEMILNDLNIDVVHNNYNPLGKRIKTFMHKHPDLGKFLEAVKWIGNEGSHIGKLSKQDLLDGFDLLQYVLYELYEKKSFFNHLDQKADVIIANKGTKK